MRKNKQTDMSEDLVPELEVHPLNAVNEYYINISNKFKTAKYAVIIILVLFVLCMISIFRNDITLENFKYLSRALTSESITYSEGYSDIYYDTAGVLDIKLFNGNLVTVKADGIDYYDMNGNNTESMDISQSNPVAVIEGKHMLVYDLGGYSYALFNNFSKLTSESYDYPISCAAVSEEGMYAVVTKSLNYQSIIHLYDHNFKLITRIYRDKYITDIKIDKDGEKLLFTSVYSSGGRFITQIESYVPYTDTEAGQYTADNSYAVTCNFFDNGYYSILTDRALLFFDNKDALINEFPLGNIVPNQCFALDDYIVLAYNKNIVGSATELTVFSSEGKNLYNTAVESKILDYSKNGDKLYLLLDSVIVCADLPSNTLATAALEEQANEIFCSEEDSIVVKYSNMARVYKLTELYKTENTEE